MRYLTMYKEPIKGTLDDFRRTFNQYIALHPELFPVSEGTSAEGAEKYYESEETAQPDGRRIIRGPRRWTENGAITSTEKTR